MVSRTPTKARLPRPGTGSPVKRSPVATARPRQVNSGGRRLSTTKRRGSPLKSLAAAPAAVASSFDRSVRFCHRRLIKLFARLAILGSPTKRRAAAAGFHRLRSSSPYSLPPPPFSPLRPSKVHAAGLPPPSDPGKKTLFLDLDETLIHSQTDPVPARYDFTVRPVIGGQAITFYVSKRPGVEDFLRAAAEAFEVVIFTAGLKQYASLVLDRLDPAGAVIAHRLYRCSCRDNGDGRLIKDLAATGRSLNRVVIVDDNPNAYSLQPENAVPVAPFIDDANDQELQRVMGFLDVAAGFDDTREAIRHYKDFVTADSSERRQQ